MTDQPHVPYQITHQEARTEPDGHGQFHQIMRVHFQTPEEVGGHVDVRDEHYLPDHVHALIMDKAHRIAQVHNLPHSIGQHPAPAGGQ